MTGDGRTRPILGWTGVVILTFAVVAAPFPFGKVLPQGKLFLEIPFLAAAILAVFYHRGKRVGMAAIPLTAMGLLALFGVLQYAPIGSSAVRSLSPSSARVYDAANQVLRLFGRGALEPRISIVPSDTLSATILVLTYGLAFYAAAVLLDTRRRRSFFIIFFLAAALCQAALAALLEQPVDRVHGTFVNPNHFAGYLEIALGVAFGFLWSEVLTGRDRSLRSPDRFNRFEQRLMHLGARVLLWGGIAAGIALTKSRGGILISLIGTAVLFLLAMSHPRETRKRRVALLGSITLLSALAVVALSAGKYPLLRFIASDPRDPAGDTRVALWRASVDAWRNFPIFGSGLGTFREAFRMVQPAEMAFLVEQAHSDSLQMLVTGGICGLFLAVMAAGSILWLLLAGARRQRHRIESAIALGGAGSLFILLLHGVVEFNFSVPAIPATLAAVCGMSWAAVLQQRESENVAAEAARKIGHPVAVDEPAA